MGKKILEIKIMQNLFSYVIDHNKDPQYNKGILSLGKDTCKWRIRNVAKREDWVIARPNRNFLKQKGNFSKETIEKHKSDFQDCLVYAMKISDMKEMPALNSKNEKDRKIILYSNNFWVFNNLIKIPKKYKELIRVKENHKNFPHKDNYEKEKKLIASFLNWLEKQHKEKPTLFQNKKNPCKNRVFCGKTL